VRETWVYDGAGRLAEKALYQVAGMTTRLIRRWQYAYDAGGNIGSKTTEVYDPPGNRVQAWTAAYGYDGIDQLTGVQYTGQVPAGLVNEWYAYDAVGNRVASYLSGAYVYNELNQLTEDADWVYGYDADGNLVERVCRGTGSRCEAGERWVMEYDAENTLRRVQKWVGGALVLEVAYAYDPLGRRIERRVVDGSQGTTAIGQYLYRDEDVVAEFRVDPTTGSRVLEKLYFHGDLGVDDPVAMFRCVGSDCRGDYQWYFYGKDHLNTVEAVWDSGTRPAASYAYSAFGLPTAPPSPLQPFTFTGREWEGEIGDLVFFRRRMYDSRTGRFTGEDPTGIPYLNHRVRLVLAAETDVQRGLWGGVESAYAYVANRPLIHVDPWGRAFYGIWCGPGPELAEGVSACSPPSQQVPGFIDPADACCKQHDCDYERCRATAENNRREGACGERCLCMHIADQRFCSCTTRAAPRVQPRFAVKRFFLAHAVWNWACCMAQYKCPRPSRQDWPCVPFR
jgi:RHS repeat-associated protein